MFVVKYALLFFAEIFHLEENSFVELTLETEVVVLGQQQQ